MGEMKSLFPEEEIQMTEKLMKRCSTLLTIVEMQVKTTVRCTEKDLEHLEFHTTLVRMQKYTIILENSLGISFKVKYTLTYHRIQLLYPKAFILEILKLQKSKRVCMNIYSNLVTATKNRRGINIQQLSS